MTKVLGYLTSTSQDLVPVRLKNCFLQRQQIKALKKRSPIWQTTLNNNTKDDLLRLIKNLEIFNGTFFLKQAPQVAPYTDAILTSWCAALQGKSIGGTWAFQERKWRINELELLEVKLNLQTFLKSQNVTSIYIQMNNIMALTYLKKMGGDREPENDYTVTKDLGNINFRTDHNYCGVPTQPTQQSGGLEISSQSGLIQMSSLSTCFLQSLPETRNPNSRLIRLTLIIPISAICCMETRSL